MKSEYSSKYISIVMNEMSVAIDWEKAVNDQELKDAVWNSLFDLDGPRVVKNRASDKSLFVANKLFRGISEIYTTFNNLENIEIYARRFPYRSLGISRLDYLKYHIENYLNEIYTLKERLIAYSKTVSRAYRKSDNAQEIQVNLSNASKYVSSALSKIVETRGAHVHSFRYSDSEIDRLSTLELLSKTDDGPAALFNNLFLDTYRQTRKKWVNAMKVNRVELEKVLDYYCKVLFESITDGRKVIYPSHTNWA
jgi:hypothetical protein